MHKTIKKLQKQLVKIAHEQCEAQYNDIINMLQSDDLNEIILALTYLQHAPSIDDVLNRHAQEQHAHKQVQAYKQAVTNSEQLAEVYIDNARDNLKVLEAEYARIDRKNVHTPNSITAKQAKLTELANLIDNCKKTISALATVQPAKRGPGRPKKVRPGKRPGAVPGEVSGLVEVEPGQ